MSSQRTKHQAASIFRKAAAYIRTYGWQEEGMGVYGQPRCSMGALDSAYPDRQAWDNKLSDLMYRSLSSELGETSLTSYNHRYQNGEYVAQLYDRIADSLM